MEQARRVGADDTARSLAALRDKGLELISSSETQEVCGTPLLDSVIFSHTHS